MSEYAAELLAQFENHMESLTQSLQKTEEAAIWLRNYFGERD